MRLVRAPAALLLGMLVLTACTGADRDAQNEPAPGTDVGVSDGGGGDESASDVGDDDQQVITTGSLRLVVAEPTAAADEVAAIVEGSGGRVDERNEHTAPGSQPSASMVVRIPADVLEPTVGQIEELGEPRDLTYRSTDVGRTMRDLDARITALETSVDRLLALLAEADSSDALVAAEAALSERQAELESLRSERAHLADQVAMSTMHIDLVASETATIEPDGFLGGLQAGWNALVTFAGAVLVAVGALLPWLAVLALLAAIVVPVWRRRRRKNRPAGPEERPERVGSG